MATLTKYTTDDGQKRYLVRWSWYDANGKRHSRKKVFAREKAATAFRIAREQAVSVSLGQDTNAGKESVASFAERWFKEWQTVKRKKPRTAASVRTILDLTIIPELGHLRLDAVTAAVVDEWLMTISPGRSAATVRRHFSVLRQMLNRAVRKRIIPTNPALGADMPTDDHDREAFEGQALDEQQIQDLADAVREASEPDSPYPLMIEFMAYTGLRCAEVAGLTIGDVRMPKGQIRVHRTLQKKACSARCDEYPTCREPATRKDGQPKCNRKGEVPTAKRRCRACKAACTDGECCWIESTTKNRQNRTVDIPTRWLMDDLAAYLAEHPYGPKGERGHDPDAPLFPGRKVGGQERFRGGSGELDWSRPWSRDAFFKGQFKPAVQRAGLLASLRLHDLRHTAGSLMLDAGMAPVDVAAQLGHTLDMLSKVYAHKIKRDPATTRDLFSASRPARPSGGDLTRLQPSAG